MLAFAAAETGDAMENNEIADDLRVSREDFEHAQRNTRTHEPRRSTSLLAVKPSANDVAVAAKRILSLRVD